MFSKDGPTFSELVAQALSSTESGYDQLAPKFDKTPFRTPDPLIERCFEDLGEVNRALDLCCGTGAVLRSLRRFTRERLVGVDFSAGMLRVARERLAGAPGSATIELVQRDVLALDFVAEFDLITCFGAFGHIVPEREAELVSVIARALVPGGRFVFVTGYHPRLLSRHHIVARAFNGIMRVRNAVVQPPFIMYYLTFLLPEVEALLRAHGFDVALDPDWFEKPYQEMVRVIATRR